MKILICGAGRIGFYLAKYLSEENHVVSIIDNDPILISEINSELDVRAILGFAVHPDILESAGAYISDILIAVTKNDEINMTACQIAHSLFQIPIKIARIRESAYLRESERLFSPTNIPIDVLISPETAVAQGIAARLRILGGFDVKEMLDGAITILGIRCTNKTSILQIPFKTLDLPFSMHVISILRKSRSFIPEKGDHFLENDHVYIAIETSYVMECLKIFGISTDYSKKTGIIIIGAGHIGIRLSKILEKWTKTNIKIIEKDRDRARYASQKIPNASIFSGDALNEKILYEAGIENCHALVSATADDETNVLSALIAKRYGVDYTVALVERQTYLPLMSSFDIDSVMCPRLLAISQILSHVRRGNVEIVYMIEDGEAEIFEACIEHGTHVLGMTYKQLNLPKGVCMIAVLREKTVYFFPKNLALKEGDHVLMVSVRSHVKFAENLFSSSWLV